MSRRSSYFKEVERLLDMGMEPKQIIKVTGIPKSTVYDIREKLREEAKYDFDELMGKDYLWKYQQTISNYSKTIQESNEEIEELKKKYEDLEVELREELASIPIDKYIARATILNTIASLPSAKASDMQRLMQQRDKASEMKAKTYNQGPVVFAINNWLKTGKPVEPHLQVLEVNEPLPESQPLPAPEISDDDLDVLKEMENE